MGCPVCGVVSGFGVRCLGLGMVQGFLLPKEDGGLAGYLAEPSLSHQDLRRRAEGLGFRLDPQRYVN